MTTKEITALSDEQLKHVAKTTKSARIINAVLIGFAFGILFISIIYKGRWVAIVIPIGLIIVFIRNSTKVNNTYKAIEAELNARNLK